MELLFRSLKTLVHTKLKLISESWDKKNSVDKTRLDRINSLIREIGTTSRLLEFEKQAIEKKYVGQNRTNNRKFYLSLSDDGAYLTDHIHMAENELTKKSFDAAVFDGYGNDLDFHYKKNCTNIGLHKKRRTWNGHENASLY